MNSMARRQETISPREYFEIEEHSPVRHEYVEGFLYALAGVSNRHDRIVVNVILALGPQSRATHCQIHTGEMMVRVSESRYYYPDVHVTCQPEDDGSRMVTSPCVIVEVLSPSTAGTDRREKLFAYQQIKSLRAYLVIHADDKTVENHWLDDKIWRHDTVEGDASIYIPCLDFNLPLTEIYDGLTFEN